MLKCRACGGVYAVLQPDGTEYYHACPPLNPIELRAAIAAGTVALSAADATSLQAARAADLAAPPLPGEPSREDLLLNRLAIDRPNKRDENVTTRRDAAGRAIIKAAGAGVDVV